MDWVGPILKKPGSRVIDLSGDFRLRSAAVYQEAYHLKHRHPSLLKEAAYGLPEMNRNLIRTSRLVANPGCYPTAVLLGLYPLVKAGWLRGQGSIVDAKSGVTGAGRSLKEELLFSEVNEDLRAYRVNHHPHTPEMEQAISGVGRKPVHLTFVPHLIPMNRGLYATVYAPLTRLVSAEKLRNLYRDCYRGEPFVRVLPEGTWPQTKSVAGTNLCEIGVALDKTNRLAIILSAIDNLGKGAAGQAVQNMNLLLGFPETQGLL